MIVPTLLISPCHGLRKSTHRLSCGALRLVSDTAAVRCKPELTLCGGIAILFGHEIHLSLTRTDGCAGDALFRLGANQRDRPHHAGPDQHDGQHGRAGAVVHTNTAIIPVPRVGSSTSRQALVLKRAKENPGDYDIEFIRDSIARLGKARARMCGRILWPAQGHQHGRERRPHAACALAI